MKSISRKMYAQLLAAALALWTPAVAFAVVTAPTNLREFAILAVKILQNVVALLFASLAIGLAYGVIRYLSSSYSDKRRSEIKEMLFWGVVGIIVVMGIWGILGILSASLWGGGTPGIPQLTPPT